MQQAHLNTCPTCGQLNPGAEAPGINEALQAAILAESIRAQQTRQWFSIQGAVRHHRDTFSAQEIRDAIDTLSRRGLIELRFHPETTWTLILPRG